MGNLQAECQENYGILGDTDQTPAEKLTPETVNQILREYLIKQGFGGDEVKLYKKWVFMREMLDTPEYEINWSAMGAQELKDAGVFANAILLAKRLAETLMVNETKRADMKITAKQQKAIMAIQDFFKNGGDWAIVEQTQINAKTETFIEKPDVPRDSKSWRLDTIVRDSYYELRQIGLDDQTAYNAVKDC